MLAPDPTGMLPALMALHNDADRLSGQLGGIERWLREIAENTAPRELVYSNSTSNGLEASRIVKSGATRLYGFSGTNTKASAQFILAFDATGIPANGAVPKFVMTAQASSDFWVSWTPGWRDFPDGCVLCNSSTAATLTIGAADCWFDAQYL
jgi:hypothetical protein